MLNSKTRVLLYAVRHNLLAAVGQLALFVFLCGGTALIISATIFNLRHHTGFGGNWADVVFGVVLGVMTLLSAISVVFNNVERAQRYLQPMAEQEQGFIYRLEEFEEKMRESINRQVNYRNHLPDSQLTLF